MAMDMSVNMNKITIRTEGCRRTPPTSTMAMSVNISKTTIHTGHEHEHQLNHNPHRDWQECASYPRNGLSVNIRKTPIHIETGKECASYTYAAHGREQQQDHDLLKDWQWCASYSNDGHEHEHQLDNDLRLREQHYCVQL